MRDVERVACTKPAPPSSSDMSGNQFYSSLGSVLTNHVTGLAVSEPGEENEKSQIEKLPLLLLLLTFSGEIRG